MLEKYTIAVVLAIGRQSIAQFVMFLVIILPTNL